MNRISGVGLTVLLLAGCATSPIPSGTEVKLPFRILAPELFEATPGAGTVSVARDTGWTGSKCPARVYLDSKAAADLQPGETAVMYASPGKHMLAVGPSPDSNVLCRNGAESMRREVSVDVVAGETARYRQAISGNGEPALMPTAF